MEVTAEATLFVVDDDAAITRAISSFARLMNLRVETFASAEEFLKAYDPHRPGCLVLDVKMPGMSGLELQQKLIAEDIGLPIIMISGHSDVPMAVEAMTAGAVTFLEKPFSQQELSVAIREAIQRDAEKRSAGKQRAEASERVARLTVKEREVMDRILIGMTNKQIAAELELSHRAIEDRRARVMRKLNVRSVAELVTLVGETKRSV